MALPQATEFTAPSVTEAQFKTALTALRDYIATMEVVPPGVVAFYPKTTAPAGWLKANGAEVSRTTYSALFAAIGTAFGEGNGSTTFNIPDLRGEFIRGLDDGRGVDTGRTLSKTAQTSQNLSHTHTTDSQGAHTHSIRLYLAAESGELGPRQGVSPGSNYRNTGSAGAHTHTAAASGGTEARPRNIALLACIKY